MISSIYFVLTLITTGNLVYVAQKKYKHTDRYLWTLIIIIPIVTLGYWMKSTVHTSEAAMLCFCFLYIFNTSVPVICLFSILHTIGVKVSSTVKISTYGITFAHLLSILLSKDTTLYYSSIEIKENYLGSATLVTSGPLKFTHYVFLSLVFLAMVVAIAYGMRKKKAYSQRILRIYSCFLMLGICTYAIEIIANLDFSLLPLAYTLGSFIVILSYDHFQSHDLTNLIGERQSQNGLHGFASFDKNRRLLEYNNQFASFVPGIEKVGIDGVIGEESDGLLGKLYPAIDLFEEENVAIQNVEFEDRVYVLTVATFSVNETNKMNGYLIDIADITEEVKQREIIEKYNDILSKEVKEKTEHIEAIQNAVVVGLANMVENRDDNTGGHVKRTSDVIKLLIDEILRRRTYEIDEQKAEDIIKAAPMHDLGKISIDNSILCKPGKLTDEEYAIMKQHAPKSGEIVKYIMEGVEEQHFVDVAYKLARNHHERWDGKGYPDGLLGEKIPVEARIMAVADVYDALVSKRCYKEAMSFDKAFTIMNECMGSQFDPAMRPVFIACKDKLEKYYREAE